METIEVRARFHTGHRQRLHEGKCRFLHGHTWRAQFNLSADRFPRDELDMSIDFASLKQIAKHLDHKFLATDGDDDLLDPARYEQAGIVRIPGRGPSVENVAWYCFDQIVALLQAKYPGRGLRYRIRVAIAETDNNTFIVEDERTV